MREIKILSHDCPACQGQTGNTLCDFCLGLGKILTCPEAPQFIIDEEPSGQASPTQGN